VVAPAAPGARHGCDDNTGTLASASAAARRVRPWPAGRRRFRRYCPVFLDASRGSPRRADHPLNEGRAPRPAGARCPDHQPGQGREGGTVYRRDWRRALGPRPGRYSACRRHQPATGGGRIGPNRSADGSADPLPAMASDQGWAWRSCTRYIRRAGSGCANGPGRCWSRVVSVPFPVPGRGLACPGTGPGKAVLAVG